MVYRVYVEKKKELANEAGALLSDIVGLLGINNVTGVRILNRYDVENIDEKLFAYACETVFSEPQLDIVTDKPEIHGETVFAVAYLPGQFDQRADSAAQCIQMISRGEKPTVRTAKVYAIQGALTADELKQIKKYVINPVEARETSLEPVKTLQIAYDIPTAVKTLEGFRAMSLSELGEFLRRYGLAMDIDDITFCQTYFRNEGRDPTVTEIRMIDTYWSDHCRHTTFLTTLDEITFEDELLQEEYNHYLSTRNALNRKKPVCLMDIGTLAAKYLRSTGKLDKLDESEEINACTVKIKVSIDGKEEPWLLLFKNETHNHPTEIEPFGGAATCIGGAIRDPLSGRAYVYGAMRVTGAADPTVPVADTMAGKLPQRKLVTTAAAGYSSYGNQIGLATGIVDEIYHPGYAAKRMEIGAVVAAVPQKNVRRECPVPGDVVILLGGKTGRDGCGGATGSSKSHTVESLETCGAEVQKGNAPEERKLQRLFRNSKASKMIKRCNDFGAGGVSVAIGELADGLSIDLNAVPKKYDGLDGTELAISESQERMAVVVSPEDAAEFIGLANGENLEATEVAVVTAEPRLCMRWNGNVIVDVSREFLNSNGAEKHIQVVQKKLSFSQRAVGTDFCEEYFKLASDLNLCSHQGLAERFDSTIGAGTVLMPFGGKRQRTPIQAMVQKISLEHGHTDDCSVMSWGYNPYISENSPFHGAYLAVVESVSKLIATGAAFRDIYLTFQEYFARPGKNPERWGQPVAALLGAFRAQMALQVAAIGGKDSMSGSFESLDVPPTLVSFAITTEKVSHIVSPEGKNAGHKLVLLSPVYDENSLPETVSLLSLFEQVNSLIRSGKAVACYTPCMGGIAEAVFKMAIGNGLGVSFADSLTVRELFEYRYGSFVLEITGDAVPEGGIVVGTLTEEKQLVCQGSAVDLASLEQTYDDRLESVYPRRTAQTEKAVATVSSDKKESRAPAIRCAKPLVLIPVFPGTNCEYDSARAVEDAGAEAEIFVINNKSADGISRSVERFAEKVGESQILFVPGGFSGGDEPDGSGKFITAFFRNIAVREQITALLDRRDGLICGICNGFQALIKLGLVPYGKIIEPDVHCPTLTYNTIGRHQSRIVRVRVASNCSPWLRGTEVGEIYSNPISHGEGRFIADDSLIASLAKNGQIATQYVDEDGNATGDILFNPNNSMAAIEGILSPDGRVIGKMGHAERIGAGLYRNVPGNYDMKLFESAVMYFKG